MERYRTFRKRQRREHFAHGLNFYKLVWIFLLGCIMGFLIETAWLFVHTGILESRKGIIYGPFSPVYGFGAVLFTIFFTDIGIAFKTWQLWTPSLIALVIGISLMLTFYMPYALQKSYLDYKLYLMCLFYFLGAGTILSAVIAKYNYGNLNYTISIEVYTYVCISLGFIFLIFAITSLCLFFRDRYRYKRKEK